MKADINYYHGCLGVAEAERRLRDSGEDGAYLLRMSDVRENMFVISSLNDSSTAHFLLPNNEGKFIRQTFDEASQIIEDILQNREGYLYPVPASGPLKVFHKSDAVEHGNTCYCCSFTSADYRVLDGHLSSHKLKKCHECKRYFKKTTYSCHKRTCNVTPDERIKNQLHCHLCDFKTIHHQSMKSHKNMHQERPFLCKEENCRKCFKSEEELDQHTRVHLMNGFKCDVCDKTFRENYQKTRHMLAIHQRANVDQERRGFLILSKNGEITVKVDESPRKKAKRHIPESDQDNNYKRKVDVVSPKISSSRTILWTCVTDVFKLSEETNFQDVSVVCQDGLVTSNKIILSSLFPPLYNIFSSISDQEEVDTIIFPDVKSKDLRQLLDQFYEVNRGGTTVELESKNFTFTKIDMKEDFDIEELDPLDDELMLDLDEEFKSELMEEDEQEIYDDEDEGREEEESDNAIVDLVEGFEPNGSGNGNEEIKTFELKIGYESSKGRTMIQCPLCDFKTRLYHKDRLVIHFKIKHTNCSTSKRVPCPICGMMNADQEKHNSRFHTEVTCEICGKTLKTRQRYYVHRDKEHGKKKIVIPEGMERCRKCKEFVSIKDIDDHSCQNQFPCEICGKIYYNVDTLRSHVNTKHRKDESESKYSCHQCGKTVGKHDLINHLKTHDPMNPCPQCGKLVRNLSDHIEVMHTDDRDKKFQCKDCGKGFKDNYCLGKHRMNVHLKLRPHKCRHDGCDVSFNDISNRNQHEKRVHGAV